MYQNHSDIPLLELKHQYFNRLPVCWAAESLKSPLCFAQFCFFRAVLWKWKAYFSLLSPCPQHFLSTFTLHSLWYIRCSFSLSFVSLTYLSSLLCYICTSFPLPLWVSRIHLNPGRFPGGNGRGFLLCFLQRRKSARNTSSWFIYCGACILIVYMCVCTLPLNNSRLFPVMTSTFFAKSPCRLCH